MTSRAGFNTSARIRWGRVVVAAIMSEVGVIAVLLTVVTIYGALIAPGMSEDAYNSLGEEVGYYVAPTAGAVMTVLSVLWVGRSLSANFIQHGLLVGLASVLLTVGFIFGARPDHRLMYVVAFALRIAGGYAGGAIARRMFGSDATRTKDLTRPLQAS